VKFSVIIPTCNRPQLLGQCLEKLAPGMQMLAFDTYEVIVTDDGRDAVTERMVKSRFGWAQYTAGPAKGPAANRNHGARQATGRWLVFTDDDCLPDAHWLQAYADTIQNQPDCKAFEGAILPHDSDLLQKDMAECPVNTNGNNFWTANAMVRHDLFWQIGGFNETFPFPINEDQEFYWRLREVSTVLFVQHARIIHPVNIISLRKKLANLPKAELSHALFMLLTGRTRWNAWQKSIQVHLLAAADQVRKLHPKRLLYNLLGGFYALIFGGYIINKAAKRISVDKR
jgi:GT2 family glycosyltransferase